MTQRVAGLIPWAILLVAAGAGGCERLHSCSLIGCQDGASLSLRRGDDMPPGLALSLELDGRTVECPAPPVGGSAPCDTTVSIESREMVSCTEVQTKEARGLTCVPNGKFEEIISIRGTPASVRVTTHAGADGTERTFQPQYKTSQPNGPDCEPTCRQWSEVWVLP